VAVGLLYVVDRFQVAVEVGADVVPGVTGVVDVLVSP